MGPLPVVMLHGIRVGGECWNPTAEALEWTRPVALPDLPGHGDRIGEVFRMDEAVATTLDAIDRLGGRALVAGYSLGGYVGMATAGRYPDRVAGLLAIGSTILPNVVTMSLYGAFVRGMTVSSKVGDSMSAWAFKRFLPAEVSSAFVQAGIDTSVMPVVVAELRRFNPLVELGRYPGQVWLVNGEYDHFRVHERRFLDACQHGNLSLWPGKFHLNTMGETELIARTVNEVCSVLEAQDS